MAVSKSQFFSLELIPDVINQECQLWQRFICTQQKNDLVSFLPGPEKERDWQERVVIYNQNNFEQYQSIISRLLQDMQAQNEPFSEVEIGADANTKSMMLEAIAQLEKNNSNLAYALRSLIGRIVIVKCEQLVACSSVLFLGLIIIAPKKEWQLHDYMENIIHEMSHIELYIKQLVDPLVIKGSYLSSPFRTQPRPASGVYHAAFVLARIIQLLAPFADNAAQQSAFITRYKTCYTLLKEALTQFDNSQFLTPIGAKLIAEMMAILTLTDNRNAEYALF